MRKNIFYILLLVLPLGLLSCNENKKADEVKVMDENKVQENDSLSTAATEISLEAVQKVPTFNNQEVNEFVAKAKKYFEDIAAATKNGDYEKAMELQLKSEDIDEELQKVKSKLNTEQQKELSNWYNKLVEAASK